jgi:segregation and condensation protein A
VSNHDYLVELETFRGPLDLLLFLVKRDEVDILDIPIARVAEQFKAYLDVLRLIDVERAGDFLVLAATLMEIKSRMLLPRPPADEETIEDPRQELVRQLLEYKRFKDAAALLERQAERQSRRLARPATATATPGTPSVQPVELWDLVSAFGRLMRETLAHQAQHVVVDQTPLHVYVDMILERLGKEGKLSLAQLFTPPRTRSRLIGLFLAILEVTRHCRVVAEQPQAFGDIWFRLGPAE